MGNDPEKALVHIKSDSPLAEEPDMDEICEFVANGSTLAKYCGDRSLSFHKISTWVKENKLRRQKYDSAIECRDDWAKQVVCNMVMGIASFDPKMIFDSNGMALPVDKWPAEARAACAEIETIPGTGAIKAKFKDRLKAVDILGRLRGMYIDKVQVEAGQSLADLVLASMKGEEKDES